MQERTVLCRHCGVEFTTKWIKQVFCTKKCNQDFHNAINNAKKKIVRDPQVCVVCGVTYIPQRVYANSTNTCSRKCVARAANRKRSGKPVGDNQIRSCSWCGEEFMPTRSDQKFCKQQCWSKNYHRTHHVSKAARHCGDCGADLSDRGPQAKYCKSCRKEQLRVAAYNSRQLSTECSGCGVKFPKPQRSTICSRSCAVRSANAKREWRRTCIACGEEFITHDKRPKTCSNSCRQWARNFPGIQRIRMGTCEYCQEEFTANRGDQRFCNKVCNRRKRHELKRAAMNGVPYVEPVTRKYIAERDKWICQLCGKKVNKRLKYPHPMCASIDHVIPLTRGGEHSRANTQLAHLSCNSQKRNRIRQPTQLALIG